MTLSAPAPATTDDAAAPWVRMSGIVKRYGDVRALDGFSLDLARGELVALLGPSGCGKTTALRALAGLESVSEGTIIVHDVDVSTVPTNRRDMGMVFQSYSLFPHLTAVENVEFGLQMRKVAASERRRRASLMLALVGLEGREDRYAHQLSGGQQQRVALARALVTEPQVLLLDEPLSALDAKVRVELREQIRRIQTELGITTLFVTHDQEEALAMADRVAVMSEGRVEQIGSPEELYSRPATAFVADFVGLSNRLPGVLANGIVSVLGTALPVTSDAVRDGDVTAYVRPEHVRLLPGGVPATVAGTSFLGSMRRTVVTLEDDAKVTVQHDAADEVTLGARVGIALAGNPVAVEAR
ncbi:ABC transporter ATP-binding protein [Demequina salsinemoris]|uniref:ABC transporter ATP-binding protein n=1 Tax=Demequina salsinemoris TaxID=577470 RepID=UPI000785F65E|nr:ABC transporter ATP-binding protein [Demequina salsinemoris]